MSERQQCVVRDTEMMPKNPGETKVVGRARKKQDERLQEPSI